MSYQDLVERVAELERRGAAHERRTSALEKAAEKADRGPQTPAEDPAPAPTAAEAGEKAGEAHGIASKASGTTTVGKSGR